jgi:uncharacterized protein (DUF362 family)/NAD-dependent dihydropyrimidine dehydrogenase PreA subunit
VSIRRCPSYDRAQVDAAVRQALDDVGGIGAFISAGDKVLLKPNMLIGAPPERGVSTHPEVVRAMIGACQRAGAAEVWVGDSPAVGSGTRAAARCGLTAVCEETGARVVPFDRVQEVPYPEGKVAKRFLLAEEVLQADKVVSLGKMKTHALTLYTGAVKNLYGTIAGMEKGRLHFSYQTPVEFSRLLLDLLGCVRPALSVVDGIVAMEGNGPQNGPTRPVGLLFAGADALAVDAVVAATIGLSVSAVPYLALAAEAGHLPASAAEIEVRGVPQAEARVPGFVLPANARKTNFPRWFDDVMRRTLTAKAVIVPELCIGCGICAEHCPAGAITVTAKQASIDEKQCIRCYCCQEMCPQNAVSLRRSALGNLLHWR